MSHDDVAIVVPWRYSPDRADIWSFVAQHLATRYPTIPVIQSPCADGPFNRAECLVNGARQSDAQIIVAYDADVVLNASLDAAIDRVRASRGWAVPHWHMYRLTPEATVQALLGGSLGPNMAVEQKPYKQPPTAAVVVMDRRLLLSVPPDVRFRGWGQEDEAWGAALKLLHGPHWQGASDLFHLWHPPAERLDRRWGNEDGKALFGRYDHVARDAKAMRALVDESKALWYDPANDDM